MGRKYGLFAHSVLSLGAWFAELRLEISESLRLSPRIFPFCGDYSRRPGSIAPPPPEDSSSAGRLQAANRRKSPATPANIPVLKRLSLETWCNHGLTFASRSHLREFLRFRSGRIGGRQSCTAARDRQFSRFTPIPFSVPRIRCHLMYVDRGRVSRRYPRPAPSIRPQPLARIPS
jgi:hypothetical protein